MRYADSEGEWDAGKGRELEGAREVVEGLLARARSRWGLERGGGGEGGEGGVGVEGGLRMEEEEDEEDG